MVRSRRSPKTKRSLAATQNACLLSTNPVPAPISDSLPLPVPLEEQQQLQRLNQELEHLNQALKLQLEQQTIALRQANTSLEAEIQERQQIEASIQDQETRLKMILELTHIVSWELNLQTNQLLLRGTLEDPAQSLVLPYSQALMQIHPDDRAVVAQTNRQAIATLGSYQIEHRLPDPQKPGEWRWVLVQGQVLTDSAGEPSQIVGITLDIHDRKQAELSVKQTNTRDRLLSEITHHIRQSLSIERILSTTVAEVRRFLNTDQVIIGRLTAPSQLMILAESVSYERESLLGQVIHAFHSFGGTKSNISIPDGAQQWDDLTTASLVQSEFKYLERLKVRSRLVVPILQHQRVWGFLIAHHCDTPRPWQPDEVDLLQQLSGHLEIAIQQAELYEQLQNLNHDLELKVQNRTLQLQRSLNLEETLRRITNKVRDSLDEEEILATAVRELACFLKLLCCNASLYDLEQDVAVVQYEYTHLSLPYRGRAIKVSQYLEVYGRVLQHQTVQFCVITPDSSRCYFTILVQPIADQDGVIGDLWLIARESYIFSQQELQLIEQVANHCAIALRQSHLYQAAQHQVKELERLNRLKDDFLNTISHELRTPVANIKLALRLLEQDFLFLKKVVDTSEWHQAEHHLNIVENECDREIQLIDDLLDLTHLDAYVEPVSPAAIVLQNWLPYLAEPFQAQSLEREQRFILDIPADLKPLITDEFYLKRILTELLTNACKYTPPQESITLFAVSFKQGLQIGVMNSGIEIPPQERIRIFDRFYRIPQHDSWKYGGTGLGLALVKKMAEYLGATIRVTSEQLQTTFLLEFRKHLSP